jgi:hypothetical protein
MKLTGMFAWLLGMQSAFATAAQNSIPQSEVTELMDILNEARSNVAVKAVRMHKVKWNLTMAADLNNAVKTLDPSWWFDANQTKARYNGQVLMDYEPFASKYPGWDFLIHDGCQNGPAAVRRIFIYRAIAQKPYFNYNNCNATGFIAGKGYINSYLSCCAHDYPAVSNKPYSWVWQYMPKLLLENTTEVACMMLGQPGPNYAGGDRPNHFFCYHNNATPQVNEQPYKAVSKGQKAGAECPGKVVKRLCI